MALVAQRDAQRLLDRMRAGDRPLPPLGTSFRLAFVGQSTYFEQCSLGDELRPLIETTFIDFRADADPEVMLRRTLAWRPHAVVVFRPELLPRGIFSELDAITIGFLTEPIPRTARDGAHPDHELRLRDLRALDPRNIDRFVSVDPLISETAASIPPVWRSLPLPVADHYYAPVRPLRRERPPLFVGRSTPHREAYLAPLKHRFKLLHVAQAVDPTVLEWLFKAHDLALNLHEEPYLSFESPICLQLAAGHLVLTEPLSPSHGLEPGIDYLEVHSPTNLERVVSAVLAQPEAFEEIRIRGRMKAEMYRASIAYPRLLHDAALDVAAFGGRHVG